MILFVQNDKFKIFEWGHVSNKKHIISDFIPKHHFG